jgi:predicted permease
MLGDLRYAVRTLRRSKGLTLVAVTVLALGIGGTTVMYSVVAGTLLRPLPFPEADRLVRLYSSEGPGWRGSSSYEDFQDWRGETRSVELMTAVEWRDENLARDGRAERLNGVRVSRDFFALLGVTPALGRTFTTAAYAGQADEVILGHDVWQHWFAGAPDVLGTSLALSGHIYTVVGVLPDGAGMPSSSGVGVYRPLGPDAARGRGDHYLQVLGRLAPGATVAQANAELDALSRQLEAAFPTTNTGRSALVLSWHDQMVESLRPSVLLLFGAVLLVLVIACANVANMLIARATARQPELAVRFALGASRARVVRQLLTESALLAALGGGLGLLVAAWGIDLARAIAPRSPVIVIALDPGVLAFGVVVAVASVLLFGLVPALRATGADLQAAIRAGARGVAVGPTRLKNALVVAQVALSFALLVGAGLLGQSFVKVSGVDPGYDPTRVVTFRVALPPQRDARAYFARLLERVRALPDVESAGLVNYLPLSNSNYSGGFEIEGQTYAPGRTPEAEYMFATPGYFQTMRAHLVAGRGIEEQDRADGRRVAVVNQTLARRYFPGANPIGARFNLENDDFYEIVGVVADMRRWGPAAEPVPEIYMSFVQAPTSTMALAARGRGDPAALAVALRGAAMAVDPEQAVYEVTTLDKSLDESLRPRRTLMTFLAVFAAVALALAAIGLYGVLAVNVAQRRRELGIRMALGAAPANVRGLVIGHGLRLVLVGVAVGAAAAAALARLLGWMLFGVSGWDPATYAVVALGLCAVALLATWLPARRATRIDPMTALRAE